MKKIIILGASIVFFLTNCVEKSNKPAQALSLEEKMEIIKFEEDVKVLEAKKEEIEISTKELQELLEEL